MMETGLCKEVMEAGLCKDLMEAGLQVFRSSQQIIRVSGSTPGIQMRYLSAVCSQR